MALADDASGAKTTVPFASTAAAFLVASDEQVFLVEADEVEVVEQQLVDVRRAGGSSYSGQGSVVPGLAPSWLITRYTLGLCAHQLGVTERALELTAELRQDPRAVRPADRQLPGRGATTR